MFVIACILSVAIIWIFKGRLSASEPGGPQQTWSSGAFSQKHVGRHRWATRPEVFSCRDDFWVFDSGFQSDGHVSIVYEPTSATSVTFALGISSFLYYNYIGIAEKDCSTTSSTSLAGLVDRAANLSH